MAFESEFEDDGKLKACAINDGDHVGEQFAPRGPWVILIKKALNAWAAKQRPPVAQIPLTDTFGRETGDLVALYKTKHVPPILNFQGRIDRVVGKKTVVALDKELPKRSGPVTNPDMDLINAANARRLSALTKAEFEIQRLKRDFEPGVPDENDRVVKAVKRQLFIDLDSNFWPLVNRLLAAIQANRLQRTPFLIDKADTANFAHVDPSNDPSKGITFCAGFFNTNDNCRHEVATHEFFHFIVGLGHVYDARDSAGAMRCPHHLARAVFDIAIGQQQAPCGVSARNICL